MACATPVSFNLLTTLYGDEAMAGVWSEHAAINAWLRTEGELALAQADVGVIAAADAELIATACSLPTIDCARLWNDARNVGYPILPLVRQIAEALPEGANGRVHYGATTQDIMDTGLALQLAATFERLETLIMRLGDALQVLTETHARTVMAGRTHAQQAVPTTFGAKMAVFLAETGLELEALRAAAAKARVISLFGAGGTSAALGQRSAEVRSALARRLDLAGADVPWHVARGRVTRFGLTMATIAALCIRFAREIVDLSRTEIAEVREAAGHHRGASSTMPQKVNPIASESIIGLGVGATTSATALLRAMEAGHERSAGEWQMEWAMLPSVAVMTASAIRLAAETAEGLQVFPDAMRRNLDLESGLIMSEAAMIRLAPTLGRERAHDLVYAAASLARASGLSLAEALQAELPAGVLDQVDGLEPGGYTGEAAAICAAASRTWMTQRDAKTKESETP